MDADSGMQGYANGFLSRSVPVDHVTPEMPHLQGGDIRAVLSVVSAPNMSPR